MHKIQNSNIDIDDREKFNVKCSNCYNSTISLYIYFKSSQKGEVHAQKGEVFAHFTL